MISRSFRRHKNPQNTEKMKHPFFMKSNVNMISKKSDETFFQAKLTIGKPGDKYEKEADLMADSIVNKSYKGSGQNLQQNNMLQRETTPAPEEEKDETVRQQENNDKKKEEELPSAQMKEEEKKKEIPELQQNINQEEETPGVQKESEEKEDEVRTKSNNPANTTSPKISDMIKRSKGQGQSLPAEIKESMEKNFMVDLSDVVIHNDSDSVIMNKSLNSQAFTVGNDIYFNSGKYKPDTSEGKRLLAHEITHVLQQTRKQPLKNN